MTAKIIVRYTNGEQEEFEPERYSLHDSNCLFMWEKVPTQPSAPLQMIRINYYSTRWVKIHDLTEQSSPFGQFL